MNMTITGLPSATPYPRSETARPALEQPTLKQAIRGPARLGWAIMLTFAAGFGTWATTVPLASGAVAPGVISPDGSRRVVQHLEGGLISEIRVHDGDFVEAGQALMLLEGVQATSVHGALIDEYRTLLATRARLTAELLGTTAIEFPAELTDDQDERVATIIESQRAILRSRQQRQSAERQVLQERLLQSVEQIRALNAQIASVTTQTELLADEISNKEALVEDGLITRSQLLLLQRQEAELIGRRGEYEARIAEIGQKRGEIESQLLSIAAENTDYITSELDKTRASLTNVSERLGANQDILDRTAVTAPVSGYVVNLRFKSTGGVVGSGEPIMEIVPADERLLIDARIAVVDIDVVHPGQPAAIRLNAFDAYRLPRIEGVVRTVSADRIIDERSGQAYYLARVEVPDQEIDKIGGAELVAGMPAEVLIVTGERTMIQYLLEPFEAALRRSFRET